YRMHVRREGLGVAEAVVRACAVRLRPILMTSVATGAGAVPAALGFGPGAETRAPMARAIIGGIVLSTLITLVLVPVFYVLAERLRSGGGWLLKAPAKEPEKAEAAHAEGNGEVNGAAKAAAAETATDLPPVGGTGVEFRRM